ncbi:hypothetical protein HELRODRAFT_169302 [Helobdella robusta]|uniref:Uncharacterized protein n=1 Tax=Helobdella robusta TaxID=6412 RepID=T1F1R3_HELRO|nr:hypothetical protein HELRODRAFT_169302 [Helobdella robusta]ESO08455.1 hypothetical protein HELRODRAFT_169302 [Helobdella robusta]
MFKCSFPFHVDNMQTCRDWLGCSWSVVFLRRLPGSQSVNTKKMLPRVAVAAAAGGGVRSPPVQRDIEVLKYADARTESFIEKKFKNKRHGIETTALISTVRALGTTLQCTIPTSTSLWKACPNQTR